MHDAIGKTQTRTDPMDPARAEALATVLGVHLPGDAVPPFFHQVYFWDARPPAALGRDGHPAIGGDGFIPSFGLPRRMWAGGRLRLVAPLRVGRPAEKITEIVSVAEKTGRSGALAFVTLRHRISQDGAVCVEEEQDLVYRAEADPTAPEPKSKPAPEDADPVALVTSSTLLFRYSALTFNGHRIHYDADYARDVEGYGGLVVHGPLLAQYLMLRAAEVGPLRRFAFRGARPLILGEEAVLCRDAGRLWVRNGDGHLVMEAEAEWV